MKVLNEHKESRYRLILLALSILLFLDWAALNSFLVRESSSYLVVQIFLLCASILPRSGFVFAPMFTALCVAFLHILNGRKVSLLELPLTFDDIFFVLVDYEGLFRSLGIYEFILPILVVCVISFVLILVFGIKMENLRRHWFLDYILNITLITCICLVGITHFYQQGKNLYSSILEDKEALRGLWEPLGQTELLERFGIVNYLSLTYAASIEGKGHIFDSTITSVPDNKELQQSIETMVSIDNRKKKRPHIVFLQLESTFDPNSAFELKNLFRTPLLEKQKQTLANGLLKVTTVGGGTNVAEFEAISGVHSRSFGYIGHYTHYAVAPITKRTFVTKLLDEGYDTSAFYALYGEFYGARKAFINNYGFTRFYDGRELNQPSNWKKLTDTGLVNQIMTDSRITEPLIVDDRPSFWFISTMGNHGPYNCTNFSSETEFLGDFKRDMDFKHRCQLNEYLFRMNDSSFAFQQMIDFFENVEKKTGRPYLLVVYGDHQGFEFTGGHSTAFGRAGKTNDNFAKVRTESDKRTTFFHIVGSVANVLNNPLSTPPHVVMLPTLVSAYLARSINDMYLPINFYAHARCPGQLSESTCRNFNEIIGSYRASESFILR